MKIVKLIKICKPFESKAGNVMVPTYVQNTNGDIESSNICIGEAVDSPSDVFIDIWGTGSPKEVLTAFIGKEMEAETISETVNTPGEKPKTKKYINLRPVRSSWE